jgi:hypothetical protein
LAPRAISVPHRMSKGSAHHVLRVSPIAGSGCL